MIKVNLQSQFTVSRGQIVRITSGYRFSEDNIRAIKIENLTTGEVATADAPTMTVTSEVFNPPIIGEVKKVEKRRTSMDLEIEPLSKKAFLSYNYEDRHIAAKVKTLLEDSSIPAFMAHDDAEPSSEWRVEIKKNLDSCSFFIPLVTDNFNRSPWTNQETGFALARGKKILPLLIECNSKALLDEIQGIKTTETGLEKNVSKIIDKINNV